jgi:4a-hydroxytetrahydrobiopterin dehydratase
MDLAELKCDSDDRVYLLDENEIKFLLSGLFSWRAEDEFLVKEFPFSSLSMGLVFANKVALIASQENQSPKIILTNEKVEVLLQTKLVEGLTKNDFIFAAKIDKLFKSSSQN